MRSTMRRLRGLLHRLDLLFRWLESGGEYKLIVARMTGTRVGTDNASSNDGCILLRLIERFGADAGPAGRSLALALTRPAGGPAADPDGHRRDE